MDELSININIADRPYRLSISRKDEETVRRAANAINDSVRTYASQVAYKDRQDLLAMAALQFAVSAIQNESELKFRDHHLTDRLTQIDHLLSEQVK
ncbi:MAG TPA: cell division protein ZapA [Bacteroidales bacterium]|nr:cell division protein ZapA [Bacteroidales bacterium]